MKRNNQHTTMTSPIPVAGERSDAHLRLPLECPKCQRLLRVPWRHLSDLIRCECGRSFLLGRDGHVLLSRDTRIQCPRCRETIEFPEKSAFSKLKCPACQTPIARCIKVQNDAEASRHCETATDSLGRDTFPGFIVSTRAKTVMAVVCATAALLAIAALARHLGSSSLEDELAEATRQFMIGTIQGKSETFTDWVDPRQGADYRLWVRNTLTPLLSARNAGSGRGMRLSLEKRGPPVTWVKVALPSDKKDVELSLAWREDKAAGWRLDASMTARHAEKHRVRGTTQREYDVSF